MLYYAITYNYYIPHQHPHYIFVTAIFIYGMMISTLLKPLLPHHWQVAATMVLLSPLQEETSMSSRTAKIWTVSLMPRSSCVCSSL